jgi:hypothetical protein
MKAALKAYLGCQGGEGVTAMLMGTRRSDPNGGVYILIESNFFAYIDRCTYPSTYRP